MDYTYRQAICSGHKAEHGRRRPGLRPPRHRPRAEKLQIDLEHARESLAGTREGLAGTKVEADKLREAMNLKSDEISFLRGHVSQLTQSINQFTLKPGDEEIKEKGWWQFWR
jgi:chromosome segregation ATPase